MWPFGGSNDKEEDKDETLFQKVTAQVGDYLFSLVVPVSILLYAAPQKSLTYIVDNAKEQVSAISDFDPEVAWNATLDLVNKTVPILQMEGEVLIHAAEKVDDYFNAIYQSPWLDMINYQYAAIAFVILAIIMSLFPWGKLVDWVAQSAWRTVMLFIGVLPLDDGLDTLNDKESGTYEIALVAGSILVTLAINYLFLISAWWGFKKITFFILNGIFTLIKKALARQIGWIWAVIKIGAGKLRRKKADPSASYSTTTPSSSISATISSSPSPSSPSIPSIPSADELEVVPATGAPGEVGLKEE